MAFYDYGAIVKKDGVRRKDKEGTYVFTDDILPVPIHPVHGVLGDGDIRVACYKQGLPYIYCRISKPFNREKTARIITHDEICQLVGIRNLDFYEYPELNFELYGHRFIFVDKNNSYSGYYEAIMIEPNGTYWKCVYDYGYGAD